MPKTNSRRITRKQLERLSERQFRRLVDKFNWEAHSRGYAVIIWTPKEIGDADAGHLEDISIERGWDFLGSFSEENDDE